MKISPILSSVSIIKSSRAVGLQWLTQGSLLDKRSTENLWSAMSTCTQETRDYDPMIGSCWPTVFGERLRLTVFGQHEPIIGS